MSVEKLIEEMKAVKEEHPTLELHEILRIFNIDALRNLKTVVDVLRMKNG